MATRETQVGGEVFEHGGSSVRETQVGGEVFVDNKGQVAETQLFGEAFYVVTFALRFTQVFGEIWVPASDWVDPNPTLALTDSLNSWGDSIALQLLAPFTLALSDALSMTDSLALTLGTGRRKQPQIHIIT